MNDILINSMIAFGLLFILIIPLYIASKGSSKNKNAALTNRCVELLAGKNMIPFKQEIIGNKAFVFSEDGKVLILSKNGEEEETVVLSKSSVRSFISKEISASGKLAEMKLLYDEAGKNKEFLLYKQHRDNALDILQLRKVSNEIRQFLN